LFLIKISKLRTAFSFWARYFIATDKIAIFANIARQTADSGNYEILCFSLAAGQGANKKPRVRMCHAFCKRAVLLLL